MTSGLGSNDNTLSKETVENLSLQVVRQEENIRSSI